MKKSQMNVFSYEQVSNKRGLKWSGLKWICLQRTWSEMLWSQMNVVSN